MGSSRNESWSVNYRSTGIRYFEGRARGKQFQDTEEVYLVVPKTWVGIIRTYFGDSDRGMEDGGKNKPKTEIAMRCEGLHDEPEKLDWLWLYSGVP